MGPSINDVISSWKGGNSKDDNNRHPFSIKIGGRGGRGVGVQGAKKGGKKLLILRQRCLWSISLLGVAEGGSSTRNVRRKIKHAIMRGGTHE